MVMHRLWIKKKYRAGIIHRELDKTYTREGWFLLGIFPLYIRTKEVVVQR